MNQSTKPSHDSSGWRVLARSDYENIMVARCPEGYIHVSYDNLTVRFRSDKFLTFAQLMGETAFRIQGISLPLSSTQISFKSSIYFSLN